MPQGLAPPKLAPAREHRRRSINSRRTRALALVLVLAACRTGGGVSGSASSSVVDELTDPKALDGCATGDVTANLAIVADLRDSYHEMIVCGGLALSFDAALVNVLANAALGRGGPSAMVYQGNGTYATSNGMMAIRTTLANGQPLSFAALDPQSYLVGFTVSANVGGVMNVAARGGSPWQVLGGVAGELDVQFQSEGPGFALLGLAADEARGGRLRLHPKRIADALGAQIRVANRISVQNEQGGTAIHYILDGAPQLVKDVLGEKAVPMTLASIVATRAETNQTIRITEWTMQFKGDGSTVLDGSIALDVDGGAFPYSVRFTYPHRKDPDIDLACR
jgi:hypothetical protein